MNDRAILLRYHEIALKGGNRTWFEERLGINARKLVQRALGKESKPKIQRYHGRIVVQSEWNEAVREALSRVFGLANFSPMRKVPTDLSVIQQFAVEEFQNYVTTHGMPHSFRVRTRRSEKAFAETSMEIDRLVGSAIKDLHPDLRVELNDAEFTVGVEIRHGESFIWTEQLKGPGGLPVGTNAPLLALISGGIDSPVAAIQTLRRGSPTGFLHFYGTPYVGEESLEKVEDLVRIINRYQPDPQPLHFIPFGKIQEKIALATHPKMRTVLYRRMMVRIAQKVAKNRGFTALVTGESLGQVASQTVENLAVINSVAEIPILRPLVTYDKDEIVEQAKKWGTFETSIRPSTDCCTLFADRHPVLRATLENVEKEEQKFSVDDLVAEALDGEEGTSAS